MARHKQASNPFTICSLKVYHILTFKQGLVPVLVRIPSRVQATENMTKCGLNNKVLIYLRQHVL